MNAIRRHTLSVLLHPVVLSLLLLLLIPRAMHLGRLADAWSYHYDLTLPALYGGGPIVYVTPRSFDFLIFESDDGLMVREEHWEGVDSFDQRVVGVFTVTERTVSSGLWAPTHEQQQLDAFYIPAEVLASPYGNTPDQRSGVLAGVEELLRRDGRFPALPMGGLVRDIVPGNSFNVGFPPHDLGSDARAQEVTVKRRILWWGYAENVLTIGVLALLVLHARRIWIAKPWRDWNRATWQCRDCRFDLRNTPEGEPCPECGSDT